MNEVNLKKQYTHGTGIWNNKRIVVGIRIDEELYNTFKPIAQKVFGSTCRPIESFMAAIIACNQQQVNFGNTVTVSKMVIERNIRTRRKLVVEEETEVTETKTLTKCFVEFCKDSAMSVLEWISDVGDIKGNQYAFCVKHTEQKLKQTHLWKETGLSVAEVS